MVWNCKARLGLFGPGPHPLSMLGNLYRENPTDILQHLQRSDLGCYGLTLFSFAPVSLSNSFAFCHILSHFFSPGLVGLSQQMWRSSAARTIGHVERTHGAASSRKDPRDQSLVSHAMTELDVPPQTWASDGGLHEVQLPCPNMSVHVSSGQPWKTLITQPGLQCRQRHSQDLTSALS